MADSVTISNERLSASIAAKGAELQELTPSGGGNVIWSADPTYWAWHAPNLFPIVGALTDDILVHDGRRYPMKQHGFLRHSVCEVIEAAPDSCAFRLHDTRDSWAHYPFAFSLTIAYRLIDDRLEASFTLENPARQPLYASLGAHPAFRWPLGAEPRSAHVVRFALPERESIRKLDRGLLDPQSRLTPVEGDTLRLHDGLFADDALIFDRPSSRSLAYGAPGGPSIELDFSDFPYLGIWSKPNPAPFVCLEPWQGLASPVAFRGEFSQKPGVVMLSPGETRIWRYSIRPSLWGF